MSQLSRQCGILNISQLYRRPRPVTGIALLYIYSHTYVCVEQTAMVVDLFLSQFVLNLLVQLRSFIKVNSFNDAMKTS
jgi:hypothetical protein